MMQTLRRASLNMQLTLRKVTKYNLRVVHVKSISVRNRDHPSPLYLKWKLKDHRNYDKMEIAAGKTHNTVVDFRKFIPTIKDYQKVVEEELKCSKEQAKSIVNLKYINQRELEEFSKIIKVVKKYDIKPDILTSNSHIIWLSSEELENHLTELMLTLDITATVALPLIESMDEMAKYFKAMHQHDLQCFKTSRIQFLSQAMSVTPYRISCWIKDYPYLLTITPEKLKIVLENVLGLIPAFQILNNPSFLRYSPDYILTRVEIYKKLGPQYCKPWLLMADIDKIYSDIRKQQVLECEHESSIPETAKWPEFLGELIDNDPEMVQQFIQRIYFLKHKPVSLKKLIHLADVFDEAGYPRKLICLTAYISLASHETLVSRLSLLKEAGVTSDEFQTFTQVFGRGRKDFEQAIKIFVASKKKLTVDKL